MGLKTLRRLAFSSDYGDHYSEPLANYEFRRASRLHFRLLEAYANRKIKLRAARSIPHPCMQRDLEDCLSLTGTGGHQFRMVIACEGRAIGMTAESVAQLFQKQRDFNYEISLKKSREPCDYDYSSLSCKKIQDQCGSIVKGYCRSCPFNHADGEKVSA